MRRSTLVVLLTAFVILLVACIASSVYAQSVNPLIDHYPKAAIYPNTPSSTSLTVEVGQKVSFKVFDENGVSHNGYDYDTTASGGSVSQTGYFIWDYTGAGFFGSPMPRGNTGTYTYNTPGTYTVRVSADDGTSGSQPTAIYNDPAQTGSMTITVVPHSTPVIIYVDGENGNNSNDGKSWSMAKKTIGGAMSAALYGDEIWVKCGTYAECAALKAGVGLYGGFFGNETSRNQRNWNTNVTTIDPSINNLAGVPCAGITPANNAYSNASVLDGFVLTHSNKAYNYLGVFVSGSGKSVVSHNVITGNVWIGNGAGIYCDGHYGNNGNIVISNNIIANNTITSSGCSGPGIFVHSCGTSTKVINNTIVGNTRSAGSPSGGAVSVYALAGTVVANNIIAFNPVGGIVAPNTLTLRNNCVYNPGGVNYSYVTAGTGDIQQDPILDEYNHLQSWSPCIDEGSNADVASGEADIDCEERQDDTGTAQTDMGADEFCGTPQVATPTFDRDGGDFIPSAIPVVISCATPDAIIHYTLDGSEPTEASPSITSGEAVTVSHSLTLKARAFKDGIASSELKSAYFGVMLNIVAMPTFDPPGGTFTSPVSVRVDCATPGAEIHYTIDGTYPTEHSPVVANGGYIAVSETLLLQAKAFKKDWYPSNVNDVVFIIQGRIFYVRANGNDANDGLSWATAKAHISNTHIDGSMTGAMNECIPGDQVWVMAGYYYEAATVKSGVKLYGGFSGYERSPLDRPGDIYTVVDPSGFDPTIDEINPEAASIEVEGGATPDTLVDGFVCHHDVNEAHDNNDGYGIRCWPGKMVGSTFQQTRPTIRNCILSINSIGIGVMSSGVPTIENCTVVDNWYGGIRLDDSYGTVRKNRIEHNGYPVDENQLLPSGNGGIEINDGNCVVTDNTILRNRSWRGGGINATGDNLIEHNEIYENVGWGYGYDGEVKSYAGLGGGIWVSGGRVVDNYIHHNTADTGGGIWMGNGAKVERNIIKQNGAIMVGTPPYIRPEPLWLDQHTSDSSYDFWLYYHCGGGIYCNGGYIRSNAIFENYAAWNGGGINYYNDAYNGAEIYNNTVARNRSFYGGGMSFLMVEPDYLKVANNIIAFNSSGIYSSSYDHSIPFFYRNIAIHSLFERLIVPSPDSWEGRLYQGDMETYQQSLILSNPMIGPDLKRDLIHILTTSPARNRGIMDVGGIPVATVDDKDIDGEPRIVGPLYVLPPNPFFPTPWGPIDIGADEIQLQHL